MTPKLFNDYLLIEMQAVVDGALKVEVVEVLAPIEIVKLVKVRLESSVLEGESLGILGEGGLFP